MTELRRQWVEKNPRKAKNSRLVYSTGITLLQYEDMLKNQLSVCAICRHISQDSTPLAVDHCHKTGKIRGLLCRPCNSALGFFRDNVENMQIAITYLQK